MLKTRVLTALVIAPLVLVIIFKVPNAGFQLFLGGLLLVGSWEFRRLADLNRLVSIMLLLLQTLIMTALWFLGSALDELSLPILAAGCMTWLLMLLRLTTYRPADAPGQFVDLNYRVLGFFAALACITFAWFSLSWLRFQVAGEWWIILLLLTIWAADIGAYFSGRFIGRHKLAPNISPGKTWEGVAGGLLLACIIAVILTRTVEPLSMSVASALLIALVTASVSVGGDLFISLHKRSVGLKDTGTLFPGHGGVLDRLDSLLSGAPFFALITWWLLR